MPRWPGANKMPAYFNVADFIKIGLMAMVFIWLANRGLSILGLDTFQA